MAEQVEYYIVYEQIKELSGGAHQSLQSAIRELEHFQNQPDTQNVRIEKHTLVTKELKDAEIEKATADRRTPRDAAEQAAKKAAAKRPASPKK